MQRRHALAGARSLAPGQLRRLSAWLGTALARLGQLFGQPSDVSPVSPARTPSRHGDGGPRGLRPRGPRLGASQAPHRGDRRQGARERERPVPRPVAHRNTVGGGQRVGRLPKPRHRREDGRADRRRTARGPGAAARRRRARPVRRQAGRQGPRHVQAVPRPSDRERERRRRIRRHPDELRRAARRPRGRRLRTARGRVPLAALRAGDAGAAGIALARDAVAGIGNLDLSIAIDPLQESTSRDLVERTPALTDAGVVAFAAATFDENNASASTGAIFVFADGALTGRQAETGPRRRTARSPSWAPRR